VTTSQEAPHFHTVGIGAGPANLSLAALFEAVRPDRIALFETKPGPAWHSGLLFPGVRMRTMWLKDLVSLADPAHRLSFLNYIVTSGRAFAFLNAEFSDAIPRLEFAQYLAWAATKLSDVYYGRGVERVSFDEVFWLYGGGELLATAEHLVAGVGSVPRMPGSLDRLDAGRVTAADDMATALSRLGLRRDEPVAVVGGGQTGAECVLELRRLGFTDIRWFGSRPWFAPYDDSPSANDLYTPDYARFFNRLPAERRRDLATEQLLTNNGVTLATLTALYQENYEGMLRTGRSPVTLLPGRRVIASEPAGDGVLLRCDGAIGPERHEARFVVVAAGRCAAPLPFDDQLAEMIEAIPRVNADYSLGWKFEDTHKIFVQNRASDVHGLQDANISLLPTRSAVIINALFGRQVYALADEYSATVWDSSCVAELRRADVPDRRSGHHGHRRQWAGRHVPPGRVGRVGRLCRRYGGPRQPGRDVRARRCAPACLLRAARRRAGDRRAAAKRSDRARRWPNPAGRALGALRCRGRERRVRHRGIPGPLMTSADAPGREPSGGQTLLGLLRHPGQYVRDMPPAIRLLCVGMLINTAGGYVALFLALILAVRHFSTRDIGIALVVAAVFAIAGSALGGVLVSRLGSRWTIVLASAGSAVFTTLFILHSPYPVMVANIGLIALCNRAFVPGVATLVGRLSAPGERLQRYATLQLSLNIGFAVGPPLATFLVTRSLPALLLLDAATSCAFAVAALRLPSEAQVRSAQQAQPAQPEAGRRPRRLRDDRRYLIFCLGVILISTAYGQSTGALPLTVKAHHYNLELLGLLISANAIAIILFQLPLTFYTRRFHPWVPLAVGGFLICAAYALLVAGISVPLLIANVMLWTLGEMIFNPVTPVVAMMMSEPGSHGSYQGAVSLSRTTGQVIGPAAGVFAYSVSAWLPWLGCGMLAVVSVLLFWAFAHGAYGRVPEATQAMAR
jgi:lysine N6-hydroxylase